MRFFTRGLVHGELSDEERQEVEAAYVRRLEVILPGLPAVVRELARLNLHDAQIERARWEPAEHRLTLSLVTWQAQHWHGITLGYSGALLGERRVQTLREVTRDRETQILAHEVDSDDQGLLSHRLLFSPRDELTIDFAALGLQTSERSDDRVSLIPCWQETGAEDEEEVIP